MLKIFLTFDFDYLADYDAFKGIQEIINVPTTVFLVGSRHPKEPFSFKNVEIGNHSYEHEEWYGKPLQDRIADLEKNHEFLKKMYGVDCKVYRSPHLRNFEDTADAMEKRGYKREMEVAVCPYCQPFGYSHLKRYFSSHHFFSGTETDCKREFLEVFEDICKQGKDFTFFLDPHHFVEAERIDQLKKLIEIGERYGEFKLLSEN